MYYSRVQLVDLAIFRGICPVCGAESNIKISREKEFAWILLIPLWFDGKFWGTCGTCLRDFEIKKSEALRILNEIGVDLGLPAWKKNLIVVTIALIIGAVFYSQVL